MIKWCNRVESFIRASRNKNLKESPLKCIRYLQKLQLILKGSLKLVNTQEHQTNTICLHLIERIELLLMDQTFSQLSRMKLSILMSPTIIQGISYFQITKCKIWLYKKEDSLISKSLIRICLCTCKGRVEILFKMEDVLLKPRIPQVQIDQWLVKREKATMLQTDPMPIILLISHSLTLKLSKT